MLSRFETFELPAKLQDRLGRGVLALGIASFASAVIGTLIT